jgi:YVTN family beta-propeller protein
MTELPRGTVTFLFTDIAGSTRVLKQLGDRYAAALAEHHRILREAVEEQDGREIDNQGDSFLFAFERANSALGAAVLAQRALSEHAWPEGAELLVRMGLHTGEPMVGEDRYIGFGVHRAARIGAVAHGGQVLLSNATRELLEDGLAGVSIRDLGSYRLKDLDRYERLFQLEVAGLRNDFPPLEAERVVEPRAMSLDEVQIGADFLGYRIEEVIGHGGMGIVYRAYDLRLKRTVALKLVTPELALDERFRERFARETELTMSLEHPNVVPIHDAGDVAGRLYLAMRLVAGTDLRKLLRAEGALQPSRALAICRQVANALDAAHARGLVHRDVKPSNILLDEGEHVYLADFGLTRRLEEQGAQGETRSVGTPAYVAPEQIEGGRVDGRADLYSLGCVLYECLTRQAPFVRGSGLETAWAHLEEEPPNASGLEPELPRPIDAVLHRAMAKSPDERYRTCSALTQAAEAAFGIRPGGRARRRLLVAAVGAAVVIAVAAAFLARGGDATPTVVPNSLVKVDVKSNKIDDVVPVGRIPHEIEMVGRYVFAASEGDGTLTRVDTRTGAVVNSGKFDASDGLAADRGSGVWVASVGRRQVMLVNPALPLERREQRITAPRVPLPRDTTGTSLTVGGGSLWVATSVLGGAAPVVERWRLQPPGRQRTYQLRPFDYGIDVTFGYGAAWVALGSPRNALLRINARTGRARRFLVGGFPVGVATGFGSVWVAERDDDNVRRIDPVTGRTQQVIAVGHVPADVAVGRESVWVTSHCDGTVSRIDPATNSVVRSIKLGYHPQWLALGRGFAWIGVAKDVYFGSCS